jgi:hypothetical protein
MRVFSPARMNYDLLYAIYHAGVSSVLRIRSALFILLEVEHGVSLDDEACYTIVRSSYAVARVAGGLEGLQPSKILLGRLRLPKPHHYVRRVNRI